MFTRVNIEESAWTDPRFATLARLCGLADSDHALIRCAKIWSWQTDNFTPDSPTYIVDADLIETYLGAAGPAAMVRARLAEETPDGLRIRGSKGRIEWLWQCRQNAAKGSRARRDRAENDAIRPASRPDADCSSDDNTYPAGKPPGQPMGMPEGQPTPPPSLVLSSGREEEERDPETAAPPLALSPSGRTPSRVDRLAIALAQAAVAEINRLRGSNYRPDSEDTLRACRVLAKNGLTPEQLVGAIRFIACPRSGSDGWLAVEHLRDRVCPATLLQAKRIRSALEDIAATGATSAGPPQIRFAPRDDDDYSRIPGMGAPSEN